MSRAQKGKMSIDKNYWIGRLVELEATAKAYELPYEDMIDAYMIRVAALLDKAASHKQQHDE